MLVDLRKRGFRIVRKFFLTIVRYKPRTYVILSCDSPVYLGTNILRDLSNTPTVTVSFKRAYFVFQLNRENHLFLYLHVF